MSVHHKPQLSIRKATNGKYRFRVSRYAPDPKGGKPGQENQVTSQMYADKDNTEQGFQAALDSMMLVAWDRNWLIDALVRTELLDKINNAL